MKQPNKLNTGPMWTEDIWSFPSAFEDFSAAANSRPDYDTSGVSTPAVNIVETPEDLRVEMVAPGMKKEAFKVDLEENVLTIAYDHEDNREGERRGWKYRIREYNYHSFMRSFQLPDWVEAEKIVANYIDGILTLRIPKKPEAITRRIDVT